MGDCVILAADRAVFYFGDLLHESANKITKTANGYITAAGEVELIQPVKDRFKSDSPTSPEDMVKIINAEQKLYWDRHQGSRRAAEVIEAASWKITAPWEGGAVLSAFYDSKGLNGLMEGRFMFTYPKSVTEPEKHTVESLANKFRYRENGGKTRKEDIDYNLLVIKEIVDALRSQGHQVSAGIDFAIHHSDWKLEIASEQLL
ncbi:hypothetical protein FCG41_21975 [Azotobacter chroococcum]|nr:hypothetical protein FCG41_21975 [Azotobacter chroococcum]